MPAFTTSQWAILVLVLLLGWLLGLLSRTGGAKWRRAYEEERDARAAEQGEQAAALAEAQARIAELERARPVVAPAAPAAAPRDELARIRGIGAAGERRLNAAGIHRFRDITALTAADEAALEERMGADQGYIEQEQWREQAALLADGRFEDHARRYG